MKLQSILSPVDFSEQSRLALQWAGAFAARFGSRLTVVSVIDPLLAEAARIRLGQDLAKQETEPALRELVASTSPTGTRAAAQTAFRTVIGEASSSILEVAEAENADLIVMGTQGLGGIQKWLLGSTTERVLRRTKIPVLAVPLANESQAAPDAGLVSHVLAATDFSEASIAAAKLAADLAGVLSAKLTLTHVVEPLTVPPQLASLVGDSDEARVTTASAELQGWAEKVCGAGDCDEVVAVGRPADTIGSIAESRGADLIVMGLASEQGAFSRRPGSIAYRVMSSTAVPVLVAPSARQ